MKCLFSLLWHLSSFSLIKSTSTGPGELLDNISIWLTYADAKISVLATATALLTGAVRLVCPALATLSAQKMRGSLHWLSLFQQSPLLKRCLVLDREGRGSHTGSEVQVTPADQECEQTPKRKALFSWKERKMRKRREITGMALQC